MALMILLGITDVVDGIIARKFNMTSDFGKALDPFADKLTQGVMLCCLFTRFRYMMIPFVTLVVKELFIWMTNLIIAKRTNVVYGAEWHGKAATVMLYLMMITHLIWINIAKEVSITLVIICVILMLLSLFIYGKRNLRILKSEK